MNDDMSLIQPIDDIEEDYGYPRYPDRSNAIVPPHEPRYRRGVERPCGVYQS